MILMNISMLILVLLLICKLAFSGLLLKLILMWQLSIALKRTYKFSAYSLQNIVLKSKTRKSKLPLPQCHLSSSPEILPCIL